MSTELEQLKTDMKRLKITEAAAVVEERLHNAQLKEPSYLVFLMELVQHEIKKREEKQSARLYKLASFPEYKTLDDFDLSEQQSLSKKQLTQLRELIWLEQAYNLILLGPPGVGKTCLSIGLGIASKWIGLYAAVGLALLFFVAIYRQYRVSNMACGLDVEHAKLDDSQKARVRAAQDFTLKRILITCGFCVIFFVLVPCVIYYLCYIPYLSPTGPVTLKRVIDAQIGMLNYHSTPGLGMDHPFQSPWWQWPFILKPMWFAQDSYEPAGYASTIMCMGNPWVFYLGAIAMLGALVACAAKYLNLRSGVSLRQGDGDLTLPVLAVGFLAQYLPWVLVPRLTFIYHYFTAVPFLVVALCGVFSLLYEKGPFARRLTFPGGLECQGATLLLAAFAAGCLLLFAVYFPVLSGAPTTREYADALELFDSWYFA